MKIKQRLIMLFMLSVILITGLACKQKTQSPIIESNNSKDTILVVLMNFKEMEILPAIHSKITGFYHLPVKILTASIPADAYIKYNDRYKADLIIQRLKTIGAGKYRFVVGLTSKDICTKNEKSDTWGIFGLGSLSNDGCISSTKRLKKGVSKEKLTERMQKVILHEIGHNHGLNHCTSPYPCFMKAAEGTIKTVDAEPMEMCSVCKKLSRIQ